MRARPRRSSPVAASLELTLVWISRGWFHSLTDSLYTASFHRDLSNSKTIPDPTVFACWRSFLEGAGGVIQLAQQLLQQTTCWAPICSMPIYSRWKIRRKRLQEGLMTTWPVRVDKLGNRSLLSFRFLPVSNSNGPLNINLPIFTHWPHLTWHFPPTGCAWLNSGLRFRIWTVDLRLPQMGHTHACTSLYFYLCED